MVEKFGKGGIFALSLHPLKRNGGRDEGTASSRGGGVLEVLTTIFPVEGSFKRGARKKSLKKLRERFGGKRENALSLQPLSLLKRATREKREEEFFNNIDVKITT